MADDPERIGDLLVRVAELEADLERAWATADAARKNALDWQQGRARLEAALHEISHVKFATNDDMQQFARDALVEKGDEAK